MRWAEFNILLLSVAVCWGRQLYMRWAEFNILLFSVAVCGGR